MLCRYSNDDELVFDKDPSYKISCKASMCLCICKPKERCTNFLSFSACRGQFPAAPAGTTLVANIGSTNFGDVIEYACDGDSGFSMYSHCGKRGEWEPVAGTCPDPIELTGRRQCVTVSSPGYPRTNYEPSTHLEWEFFSTECKKIIVAYHNTFGIAWSRRCEEDYVMLAM